jgi:hypothetical protein
MTTTDRHLAKVRVTGCHAAITASPPLLNKENSLAGRARDDGYILPSAFASLISLIVTIAEILH